MEAAYAIAAKVGTINPAFGKLWKSITLVSHSGAPMQALSKSCAIIPT
jgi:hypothetical protein